MAWNPDEAYRDFEKQVAEKLRDLKRPTILVAGYTGSGKTSLIQGICGKDVVPDDRIAAGLPKTTAFDFYENHLIRIYDSKGLEPGVGEETFTQEASRFVRKLQEEANVDNHVHLVWYTVQGSGARVTPCDLRLIGAIFPNVIVLITKNDITRAAQREAMTTVLTEGGVSADRILPCSDPDKHSLMAVVELSHELLPDAYRQAFVSAQIVSIDMKQTKAMVIISTAAAAAAAAGGLNPFPLSDAAFITPIQTGMIASLAVLYNEPKEAMKAAFMSLIAETVGTQAAASLTKLIPGLGQVMNATVAGGLTGAVGYIANMYLVSRLKARAAGETPPDFHFDLRIFKNAYDEWKKRR